MSPSRSAGAPVRRSIVACLIALAFMASATPTSGAVRLMNYNMLNWSGASGAARTGHMLSVTRGVGPDLVVGQELIDQAGVDLFRDSVLNWLEPGEWVAAPFDNGPDSDNALWYKPAKWTYLGKKEIPTALRNASRFHMRLAGYNGVGAEVYVYSFHLKASSGSTNEALRLAEMKIIRRDAETTLPLGSHVLFCGDYNVYTSSETPFQWALSDTGQNIGRMRDPINQMGAWNSNVAFAPYHTQSPRSLQFGGGATGGVDDRFDFVLESYNMDDGQGMDLDESTYRTYGNDGLHCCNSAINAPPTNAAIGQLAADSLMNASDHMPVQVEFIVPAKLGLSTPAIAFGTVIQGGPADQPISLSNPVQVPGDALDYTFDTAPAGFSAPASSFIVPAGATGPVHMISMDTGTIGVKGAQLGLFSDAPDFGYGEIDLSGTVVEHAQASLDSFALAMIDTVDFGTQSAGGFSDQPAQVWNLGFNALQAQLHVSGASITGDAAARFSLVEPFVPELVGLDAARYDVHFDDSGVTADSTFEALLTFAAADDPALPGAIPLPSVSYRLVARFTASTVGVEPEALPTATLLYAPTPNPVRTGRLSLRFDLAQAGRASIELFDVRGRRVVVLGDGERPAGRHSVTWNGLDSAQRPVANGVYFVRMVTPQGAQSRRFLMLQ